MLLQGAFDLITSKDYYRTKDECCSAAVKPILTQWGLVLSFTTSDLGGSREKRSGGNALYSELREARGGGGERRLLHKENFSTYKRRIPTAPLGLCSRVTMIVEFKEVK